MSKMHKGLPCPHVVKMGYLKKLKTMKKKWFVLQEDNPAGPACLEYYDSEKKFLSSSRPKRTIVLKKCLCIKTDAKHKNAVALFTKDDFFGIVCENEEEQQEWLTAVVELRNYQSGVSTPHFEHIWPVTLKSKGLGDGKPFTPGPYRLCLTNKSLSLIRLNEEKADLDLQMACIRRCGHTGPFFFLELGRQTVTGAGELWMMVEDIVIAQNMHEAILGAMKNSNVVGSDQPPPFRQRSRSSVPDKPVRVSKQPNPLPSQTTTLPLPPTAGDPSTLPKRSKTMIRTSPSPSKPLGPNTFRPPGSALGASPVQMASSPTGCNTSSELRERTYSMESRDSHGTVGSFSAEDFEMFRKEEFVPEGSSGPGSTRSATPDSASHDDQYLDMDCGLTRESSISPICEYDSYMAMGTESTSTSTPEPKECTPTSTPAGYMDMSHAFDNCHIDMIRSTSTASPAASTSGHETDDSQYFDMSPHPISKSVDCGYLEMSPGSCSPQISSMLRPEKVCSYLTDDGSLHDFPKRAYSVGSKPTTAQRPKNHLDVAALAKSMEKGGSKTLSAPHLNKNKTSTGSFSHSPDVGSTSSLSSQDKGDMVGDRFMEMDFKPRLLDTGSDFSDFRPRASSGGAREFRTRKSSFNEQKGRTRSFGSKDTPLSRFATLARARAQEDGQYSHLNSHRPRTSTICQDSLRPRASSFGSNNADMRPRSSSHGTSRYKDVRHEKINSKHLSQESLKHNSNITSQESVNSEPSDYLDMQPGISTAPSAALVGSIIVADKLSKVLHVDSGPSGKKLPEKDEDTGYFNMEHASSRPLTTISMEQKVKGAEKFHTSAASSQPSKFAVEKKSKQLCSDSLETTGGDYVNLGFNASSKENTIKDEECDDAYMTYSPKLITSNASPVRLEHVISPIRKDCDESKLHSIASLSVCPEPYKRTDDYMDCSNVKYEKKPTSSDHTLDPIIQESGKIISAPIDVPNMKTILSSTATCGAPRSMSTDYMDLAIKDTKTSTGSAPVMYNHSNSKRGYVPDYPRSDSHKVESSVCGKIESPHINESSAMTDYSNMTIPCHKRLGTNELSNLSGSQVPDILDNEPQLNYATLDLQTNETLDSAVQTVTRPKVHSYSGMDTPPQMQYAEIDFDRPDAITESNIPKETKPPFDL